METFVKDYYISLSKKAPKLTVPNVLRNWLNATQVPKFKIALPKRTKWKEL
jgi:hypothetical protein